MQWPEHKIKTKRIAKTIPITIYWTPHIQEYKRGVCTWKPMELSQHLTFRSLKEGLIIGGPCRFEGGWFQKHIYFQYTEDPACSAYHIVNFCDIVHTGYCWEHTRPLSVFVYMIASPQDQHYNPPPFWLFLNEKVFQEVVIKDLILKIVIDLNINDVYLYQLYYNNG